MPTIALTGNSHDTIIEEDVLGPYRPDPEARRRRVTEQIRRLYSMGCDGEKHQPVLSSYKGQLGKMFMYITFRCPNRCPFCCVNAGESRADELPPERLAEIVKEAADAGMRFISITGGEPLVYGAFDDLLDRLSATDRGKSLLILRSSLALPITEERIRRIAEVFDGVITSLDGDEKTHDALRGPGRYKNTVENLKRIIETGQCYTGINAVMEYEAFTGPDGEHVKKLADELGTDFLTFGSPKPLGRAEGTVSRQYQWRKDETPGEIRPRFNCALGRNLYMQPDGSLYPCYAWCEAEHRLGNLAEESLPDVLEREGLLRYLNSGVDTNEKCQNCELRYLCGGMCKAFVKDRHNLNSGDFDCTEKRERIMRMLKSLGITEGN